MLQHALAFLAQWCGKNPGRPSHHSDVSLRSSGHGGLNREHQHGPLTCDQLCGAEGPGRPVLGATKPSMGGAALGKARSQHHALGDELSPWIQTRGARAAPSSHGLAGIKERPRWATVPAEQRPALLLRASYRPPNPQKRGHQSRQVWPRQQRARAHQQCSRNLAPNHATGGKMSSTVIRFSVKAWEDISGFFPP